jgi:hypothetical protein
MIAEAGAAIGGIKVAMDMAKGLSALKSEAEINQAIIDIQRTLLDAQTAAIEDKERIAGQAVMIQELQTSLKMADDWVEEAKRYILTESEMGTFTYELRPEFSNGETHHRLCVACFGNGKKSILQGERIAECQTCGKRITRRRPTPVTVTAF